MPSSKLPPDKVHGNDLKHKAAESQEAAQQKKQLIPLSAAPMNSPEEVFSSPRNQTARAVGSAAKSRAAKPQLQKLLHNLPSNVTTISACMAAVATVNASGSGTGSSHLTGLIAAATVGGSIELVTFSCGSLMPLAAQISISLGETRSS